MAIVCTADAIAKDNTELVFDRDCPHVRRRNFSRLCSAVCLSFLCLGLGSPVSHVTFVKQFLPMQLDRTRTAPLMLDLRENYCRHVDYYPKTTSKAQDMLKLHMEVVKTPSVNL